MINRVVLVGRLTKDLELRKTTSGISNTSFTLAVNRKFKQEGQPDADFINCVAWRQSADFLTNYASKGTLIGIEGRIQTRSYDDAQGKRIYITEVVCDSVEILESKRESVQANSQVNYHGNVRSAVESVYEDVDINADDLPF